MDHQETLPLVQFHNVTYSLPNATIISDLSLTVERGETLVLLGESGCGKTTTLKLINRLLTPSSGEVRVEGKSTTAWDPIELRRRIGYVIQEIGLFPHLTVADNIGIVPRLEGWDAARIRARAETLLRMVGLDPDRFAARMPRELSGGQRQRIGVARALAADPPFVLLDEPFGALDPITRTELQREFRDLVRGLGKAALFVTHDLREALAVGDRVGVMDAGRLVALEPADRLLSSDHPAARALVGTLDAAPATQKAGKAQRDG